MTPYRVLESPDPSSEKPSSSTVASSYAALHHARRFGEAVFDSSSGPAIMVDNTGAIVRFNSSCEFVTGYSAGEVIGKRFWALFLPADRAAAVARTFADYLTAPERCTLDNYWLTRSGEKRLIAWATTILRDDQGVMEYLVGMGTDLTTRREAEEAYAYLSLQTEMILNAAGDGIYGVDRNGITTFVNPAAARMLGYAPDELIGSLQHAITHHSKADGTEYPAEQCPLYQVLRVDTVRRVSDEVFWRKDGTCFPVEYVGTPMHRDGEIIGAVCTFTDITERKQAEAALRHQATHDALTDLPNRSFLHSRLRQELNLATREGRPLTLLLLDLDHFKEVNDTLGHYHGDLLLREVAGRLNAWKRPRDLVARLGGDEFAALLPALAIDEVQQAAERLLMSLQEPFAIEGRFLSISGSIGIAQYPVHSNDGSTLLRQADVAMYVAKRAHLGTAVYSSDLDQYSTVRFSLMSELRQAIEGGQLLVYYQPKVEIPSGALVGVEALVRWQHPVQGLVPPDQFIPLAEQTGLIGELTRCVLETALCQTRAWEDRGLVVQVAVNLSMWGLQDPALCGLIQELLERYNLPPERLCIELTESAVMNDVTGTMRAIHRLSDLGVHLAIDDFGTGYSSLAYLKHLPIHELKIDKSFLLGLKADSADAAILSASVGLGHSLGLRVVAEGVESYEVWELLAMLGCDIAQGYYFNRPLPADALEAWAGTRKNPWESDR